MEPIPFARPSLGEEEIAEVTETIRSGWITQGPRVAQFEEAFAAYVGADHAVAVSSCTTALHLGLLLLGVGEGDEVIVPPHSFIATANAVRYCGAKPVFVDIDPATLNLDPRGIPGAITSRTKAILLVHQVGRPAALEEIAEIARRHGIPMIEDAACAAGSSYRGMKIGGNRYSSLVCFSFHPRKILSTGDGGMITTDRADFAQRARLLRQHGMSLNDLQRHDASRIVFEEYVELGYNYRMTDLQASLGIPQLKRLDQTVAARRALTALYDARLEKIPALRLYREPSGDLWNQQTYLARLEGAGRSKRDAVMQKLLDVGIPTRRGIMSIHREPCYRGEFGGRSFPHSEGASDECLCLPLYPGMTSREVDRVAESLAGAVGEVV